MKILRLPPLIAVLAAVAALGAGAPAAGASVPAAGAFALWPSATSLPAGGVGACATGTGAELMGRPGGVTSQVCGGLSFIGPAIGQIDTNIGPTIISPAVTGSVIVTGNNVAMVP